MPQRHFTVKAAEPTPLRRSPRLIQLKNPPKPQDSSAAKIRSSYNLVAPPNFDSPPLSSMTRSSRKKMVQNDCTRKSSESFDTGWRCCGKSNDQSREASTLSGGVEGVLDRRRSPRLLSLRYSHEYIDKTANRKSSPSISSICDGSLVVQELRKSKLSENEIAAVELNKFVSRHHHSVTSGVTPLKGGEGKVRSFKEEESINQSRKGSALSSGVEGVLGRRRSPRLLSWRNSEGDVNKTANGKCNPPVSVNFNGNLVVSEMDKSKLSQNEIAEVELHKLVSRHHHSVTSEVTLLKGGEGKVRSIKEGKSINQLRKTSTLSTGVQGVLGRRRSPRLLSLRNSREYVDRTANEVRSIKEGNANGNHSSKQNAGNLEGRMTRIIVCALAAEKQERHDSCKCIGGGSRKMITRSSVGALAVRPSEDKEKMKEVDRDGKEGSCSGNQVVGKLRTSGCNSACPDATPDIGNKNTRKTGEGFGVTGVKRKREQIDGIDQGWTKEQELALQRAYFSAKPTPHFWKKVAKLVPGKSAQECFDKVNSNIRTPTVRRPRSRARTTNSLPLSDFSCSASKLLKSSKPKGNKVRRRKRKSHVAQKTVRHLLQKYCRRDEHDPGDLFSVLEPNANPSAPVIQQTTALSSPVHLMENLQSPPMHRERSSSGHKKCLSRFNSNCGSSLLSPPVLKPVKNLVLHEKYIDQLHDREAKRKAASLRNVKSSIKEDKKQSSARKKESIRAAKSALVSHARDAISRFQHLQVNITENSSDSEECSNDDEDDNVDEKVF